jgi:glycosyltransferase involved in cell wall biosynthesis
VTALTILHLAANRWWTGSADPVIQLVRGLRARGHRVLLALAPGDRFEAKAREAGIEPLGGVRLDVRFRPLALGRDILTLRRAIREHAVQIVHVHHSHDHWVGAAVRGRSPLVRTFHNARAIKTGTASRWLYRRTDAAVAVSAGIEARCRLAGFAAARIHRVSGATDPTRFRPSADGHAIRQEFQIGQAPLVGCVARLAPTRGHDRLIEGFRRLLTRVPDARLLLVGKGEARGALDRLVADAGLDGRVLFAGYRDHDLPQVLAALDCFALMGAGSEESCRAVLEAMAAGCPVVAARVGALPDTIVHGETGFLLAEPTPDALAEALALVLSDRALARAMGAASRRRVQELFTPERQVDAIEAVYRRVLAAW